MKKLINVAKEFSPSIIALAMAVPALAFAQLGAPPSGGGVNPVNVPQGNISSLSGVLQLLCNVFGWAFYFLIVLAVIFVLYAAFKYLTAAGEPEKVKEAGSVLLYAAIAVGVALLAKAVPLVVGSFLGAGTVGSC